jgi:tetratricopeptide (TPR) repeat protein
LDHPNICNVHEFGETDDGRLFIAMAYYAGESLRHKFGDGPLGAEESLDYAIQIARGLAAAHGAGIVHRDIKPANVVVTEDGVAKIVDFGIARVGEAHLTQTGATLGTTGYMSPEQTRGEEVDGRADIWALGVVLYEALTGVRPFRGDYDQAVIYSILNEDPEPVRSVNPDVSSDMESVINRCLQKDPAERYQDAEELLADLEAVQKGAAPRGHSHTEQSTYHQNDLLLEGRTAAARGSWREAMRAFQGAEEEEPLSAAEDLGAFAEAAWWTGDLDTATSARERAVGAYLNEGDTETAGLLAVQNSEDFGYKRADAVASGWFARAERLLADDSDSLAYGHLQRLRSMKAMKQGELELALTLAKDVHCIGELHRNLDLQALSLQDQGRILISLGQVEAGFPLVDEAMASAVSGELTLITTGRLYCNMMETCEHLSDYERASQWSDVGTQWCQNHTESLFPGICRVYRAKVLGLRGAWSEALEEAVKASEEMRHWLPMAGEAWYQIGNLRLRLGDFGAADSAFQQAHELGREPFPGIADLRQLEGHPDQARSLIDAALSNTTLDGPSRARLLPTKVSVALAEDDVPAAEEALGELAQLADQYPSPVLSATLDEQGAAVALATNRIADAIQRARKAAEGWSHVGFPFETARARVGLARAFLAAGERAPAQLELRTAKSGFERLGAKTGVEESSLLLEGLG